MTLLLRLWLGLTALCPAILNRAARRAHARQKADPARLAERRGIASLPRPEGRVIWIHAASVGEVVSVATLAKQIAALPGSRLLMTTTTATGAATVAERLPEALHQFLPVDSPAAVRGFLGHWRPDAALFVEADLWPRMMLTLAARGVPRALLNARPSKTRKRAPRSFARLLSGIDLVTVQEPALLEEFAALGLGPERLFAPGNLKGDIAPPAVDPALRDSFLKAGQGRRIWAAVSTHPGEDEIVLEAHQALHPAALLLLVPRHPERGEALAAELARRGIPFTRASRGESPDPATGVHLIDLLGVTGSVYASARIALIGGSLLQGPGGHTPFEPAALGCPMLCGPWRRNFAAVYDMLLASGATFEVRSAPELRQRLEGLLENPDALSRMREAALAEQARNAGATARTLTLLAPLLHGGALQGR